MTRGERWLAGIAATGVLATIAGVGLVWLLLTSPERAASVPAAVPHEVVAMGQWVWHWAQRLAEWL
jgi:hypothetical protein